MRWAKRIQEPAPYTLNSIALNTLGIQVLRSLSAEALHRVRPGRAELKADRDLELLGRDGLTVIENFLSEKDFERARSNLDCLIANRAMKVEIDKDGSGVTWTSGAITNATAEGGVAYRKDSGASSVAIIGERRGKKRVRRLPQLIYQRLEVPAGGAHRDDCDAGSTQIGTLQRSRLI